ncbi:MAG: Rieske (2Fe-2S) protein [Actinomycetota bacterium]|nr:Rieske (2Fe-2S) protein [Actinomycetota bacterium]
MPEPTIHRTDEQPDPACQRLVPGAVDRRRLLRGGAGLAAGAALVACGDDGGTSPADTDSSDPADGGDGPTGDTNGAGAALTAAADVPVGGGSIFGDAGVVVTQPAEGEFMAFSSVCTHQGCQVADVTETINCDCHGSRFSIEDGSVVGGPAPSALSEIQISVDGDQISLA